MQKELPGSGSSQAENEQSDFSSYHQQQIIAVIVVIFYGLLSVCLVVAAFLTQSMFLLPMVPLMARHWAYAFRKAIDKLLTPKK